MWFKVAANRLHYCASPASFGRLFNCSPRLIADFNHNKVPIFNSDTRKCHISRIHTAVSIFTPKYSTKKYLTSPIMASLVFRSQYSTSAKPELESKKDTKPDTKSTDEALKTKENASDSIQGPPKSVSMKSKLKQAVKDYGMIVVGFHITISLMSLGFFYALVSSGIDMVELLRKIGIGEHLLEGRLAAGASTFVVAYAIHKVFAPARIGITLASAPVIVNKLRKLGVLKKVA